MKFDIETKSGYFKTVYDHARGEITNLAQIKILSLNEMIISHGSEGCPKYSELEPIITQSLYAACGYEALIALLDNQNFFPPEWWPHKYTRVPFVGTRLLCLKRKTGGSSNIAEGREYFPMLVHGGRNVPKKWRMVFTWTEEAELYRGNYYVAAYIPT